MGMEGVKDILGLSSLVWVPVPTEAILRGASLFSISITPCIIPRTPGPEETGKAISDPLPPRSPLLGKHSPLSSKYLIEMRKTLWLTISLKTKGQYLSLLYPSVLVPSTLLLPGRCTCSQRYNFYFLTNLIFFNYKSNTYLGFSIIFKKTSNSSVEYKV